MNYDGNRRNNYISFGKRRFMGRMGKGAGHALPSPRTAAGENHLQRVLTPAAWSL